jgi:hypothetical protein
VTNLVKLVLAVWEMSALVLPRIHFRAKRSLEKNASHCHHIKLAKKLIN